MSTETEIRPSPWRSVFERVRTEVGDRRDEDGVLGSINWLRRRMERRGANPNVVRNILYRDKGKPADKRALFEILEELWSALGNPPLDAPALAARCAAPPPELEMLRPLGPEHRAALERVIDARRAARHPKLLVTGRPGSGKSVLADALQRALERDAHREPRPVRLHFGGGDLAISMARLGAALGVPAGTLGERIAAVETAGPFAVQADAQADVARTLLDAARRGPARSLLLHVSQSLGDPATMADVPLRLNTPDVPRVAAAEWLWLGLIEPLGRLPNLTVVVTMTEIPVRAMPRLGAFDDAVRLSPPTPAESKRFVRTRLPDLCDARRDELVRLAGRSFEVLRVLALIEEIRGAPEPAGCHPNAAGNGSADTPPAAGAEDDPPVPVRHLASLAVTSGDARLRDFLAALAVLSSSESPLFEQRALDRLRGTDAPLGELELAFLDRVPSPADDAAPPRYRCFSRQLARAAARRLEAEDPARYRDLHRRAARDLRAAAEAEPDGEDATRYLEHALEGRDWSALTEWLTRHDASPVLVRRVWRAARGTAEAHSPRLQSVERAARRRLATVPSPPAAAERGDPCSSKTS